jgi:hypothetical protein
MKELKKVLMRRDGMTEKEADEAIAMAEGLVMGGADPEQVLQDEFGLEADFFFDIIP